MAYKKLWSCLLHFSNYTYHDSHIMFTLWDYYSFSYTFSQVMFFNPLTRPSKSLVLTDQTGLEISNTFC